MSIESSPVLLVEDDENDVLLIRRAFRKANVANPLRVVRDGEQAIDYLIGCASRVEYQDSPKPVLVLLDLKLPRKSGAEVLEWLQGQDGLRRLPVVVFTSSRQPEDVNRVYDLGANSYLVKPLVPDDLLEMVKTIEAYWLILNQAPDMV